MIDLKESFHHIDPKIRSNLLKAYNHYENAYIKNLEQFYDITETKKFLRRIRLYSLQRLNELFAHFEKKFVSRGGIIHYASNALDALEIISTILAENQIVVKSKSMLTEEIELNRRVGLDKKLEIWETDLGEFIIQQMGQSPSHLTAPAIHLSREEIFKFFHKRFGAEETLESVINFVRKFLRKKILAAKVGITGANFLVAEVGAIAITENEGNAGMCMSWPDVHIILATPEKIVSSLRFMSLLWPVLATHATGQRITAYNHLVFGPSGSEEIDGPKEVHLILLDNKRSKLFTQKNFSEILTCIRCGACLTICPIFLRTGGHAFQSVYGGPMGSILTPLLNENKKFYELSFVCTQCGLCAERCPVSIRLDHLLLLMRNKKVKERPHLLWKIGFILYARSKLIHKIPGTVKSFIANKILRSSWNVGRVPLKFSRKTYTGR